MNLVASLCLLLKLFPVYSCSFPKGDSATLRPYETRDDISFYNLIWVYECTLCICYHCILLLLEWTWSSGYRFPLPFGLLLMYLVMSIRWVDFWCNHGWVQTFIVQFSVTGTVSVGIFNLVILFLLFVFGTNFREILSFVFV